MTGRGADLLIIDDPHSETAGISPSLDYFDSVYEWYASGPRQRLQPGWCYYYSYDTLASARLTGQILQSSEERKGSDKWEVIELPALYESGEPLWPDFWSKEELDALKAELPISSGQPSTNNSQPLKKVRLSKESTGRSGVSLTHQSVTI